MTTTSLALLGATSSTPDAITNAPPDVPAGATPFAQFLDRFAASAPADASSLDSTSMPGLAGPAESADETDDTELTQTPQPQPDSALIAALLDQLHTPLLRAAMPPTGEDGADAAAGSSSTAASAARPLTPSTPALAAALSPAAAAAESHEFLAADAGDAATANVLISSPSSATASLTLAANAVTPAHLAPGKVVTSAQPGAVSPQADAAPSTVPPNAGGVTADTATITVPQNPREATLDNAAQTAHRQAAPGTAERASLTARTDTSAGGQGHDGAAARAHAARAGAAALSAESAEPAAGAFNPELASANLPQRARAVQAQSPWDTTAIGASAAPFALGATAHTDAAPAPNVNLTPRLDTPEWKPAFTQGMRSLLQDGMTSASLQLNPAELGPVDVRIVMTEQRADISFVVKTAEANQAIQSALPDLREQLARSGIELGQASVGGQRPDARAFGDNPRRDSAPRASAADAPAGATPVTAAPRPRALGQIDTFA